MVALRPEVEKFGLVLPSRKAPHSGCLNFPQPAPERARSSRSAQPSFLPGHPSASAIGLGMAMTSGDAAIFCTCGGTSLGLSEVAVRCSSRVTQPEDAGVHTSGRGPSTDSCQPAGLASAAMAAPDALLVTWIWTQRPSTCGRLAM